MAWAAVGRSDEPHPARRRQRPYQLDAYGWPRGMTDEAILERLLALNLERKPASGG